MLDSPPPVSPAWLRGAHLAALWTLAFVQPLLDLLGQTPEFFVARGNGRGDIVIFSLALAFGPPLLMLALEALVQRVSRHLMWGLHLVLVGALASAIALQALKDVAEGPAGALIAASAALGGVAALAYWRMAAARSLTTFLTPAPALVLALFLFFSDASELVLPQPEVQAYAAGGDHGAPVVMLILDELPTASLMDGHGGIDSSRFPGFAALSRHATWYRNATAVGDHTHGAVPAILTGTRPRQDRPPTATEHPRNLFTLLGGSYRMNVNESVTQLCPESICGARDHESFPTRLWELVADLSLVSEHLLLPEAIAQTLPPVGENFSDFRAGTEANEEPPISPGRSKARSWRAGAEGGRLTSFLSGINEAPRTLHFLHATLPHVPWMYLPSGQRYQRTSVSQLWLDERERWLPYPWVSAQGLQSHLLQTGFADTIVERMIRRLRVTGVWDRALVVVTADHGAGFTPEAPRRYVALRNAGEVAAVPLFIKAPGQRRGRIVDRPVRTIDVLPTIADEIGIKLPFAVDGRPARRVRPAEAVTVYRADSGPRRLDLRQLLRSRDRLASRKARLFGSEAGWNRVYRFGPHHRLVGKRVHSLDLVRASVEITDPGLYRKVHPRGPFVPSLLQGTLEGVPDGAPLAVAVNGRIAAVTRAYRSATGSRRMVALIPPRRFQPGANEIEIYRLGSSS